MKVLPSTAIVLLVFAMYQTPIQAQDQDNENFLTHLLDNLDQQEQTGKIITMLRKLPQAIDKTIAICTTAYLTCKRIFPQKKQYDLQEDVLQNPFKQMVYNSTREIEFLIVQASSPCDPVCQIQAILELYKINVPAWYAKSFQAALNKLYPFFFDAQGRFFYPSEQPDIKKIFKRYLKKSPKSWQRVAAMKEKWYQEESLDLVKNQFVALCDNEYNRNIEKMILAVALGDMSKEEFLDHLYRLKIELTQGNI